MSKTEDWTNKFHLVLASQSPRRKQLVGWLGIPFSVMPSNVDEITELTYPGEVAEDLSALKGRDIWEKLEDKEKLNPVVVSSDTVVSLEGKLYGKPTDVDDARRMLTELSGKTHQVYTGVFLKRFKDGKPIEKSFYCRTDVTFDQIDENTLEAYLETGESLDKAGSYGIQGQGLSFISRVEGSYSNVVGFPLSHFREALNLFMLGDGAKENWRDLFGPKPQS